MPRGGKRKGAGSKPGTGSKWYGEETQAVRLPVRHITAALAYVRELMLWERKRGSVEPAGAVPPPTSFRGDTAIGSAKSAGE